MTIQDYLARRFFAADGAGSAPDTGGAAAVVDAIAGNAVTVPEGETEAATDELDDLDGLDLDGAETEAADPEDWEDLTLDDLKVRVPKGMTKKAQEALMRQADYTRKTQEAAERARQIEAREKALQVTTEYDPQIRKGEYFLETMDSDLENEYKFFQSPDYQKLQAEDYAAADARWKQYQLNLQTRAKLVGALQTLTQGRNSKLAEIQQSQAAELSKRREQLPREIAKIVPGWNSERQTAVKEFALTLGYTPEALDQALDPVHWQTLDLARIGKAYLQAKARKAKGTVETKPAPATKTVGQRGGGTSSGPSDRMSVEDWMKAERNRVAAAKKAR
jgi:hypothetical protein